MASRDLKDLDPDFRQTAESYLKFIKWFGFSVIVICTYRSSAEQDELYAQGRTAPGNIVTKARGGESPHNCTKDGKPASLAFDIVFGTRKKVIWTGPWWVLGKLSRHFNLEWGGDWKFKDCPHFQRRDPPC